MKYALISVFDKSGIVEFARSLRDLGFGLISTGGTFKLLKEQGIEVSEVSEITQFPEMMGGRVKTLHPRVHAGILYRRDVPEDIEALQAHQINAIDIVVNNLYPFEEMLHQGKDDATMIENIDIGGPSMIRAAAKNHKDVTIVVDPQDYAEVIQRLQDGTLDEAYRRQLAAKAFSLTAYYDGIISSYFNSLLGNKFPERFARPLKLEAGMRYGENPHQAAALYRDGFQPARTTFDFEQLHGKEISYNNMNDLTGAVMMLKEFDRPCAVGVKHSNPTGIACDDDINIAFDKMIACDDVSIFGGIIAINRAVTAHIAERINTMFMEIVIAPDFEPEAFDILAKKKNIRLIKSPNIMQAQFPDLKYKDVINGTLLQENDKVLYQAFNVVSKRQPSQKEIDDMVFGMKAVKHISSNGVVLVKDEGTVGYGFGEVRRSWAVEKAIERGAGHLEGSVLASDAFFFEDTVELLHANGIKAAISPGGSIHDQAVIDLCDQYGIALVFTETRHFRH
ncbi:MAG TPA: bifunctional phosphoribosylaminoimidazolecarboxamide formyltransferase/IMP cyclohydrolase [Anaerolineaceae bacterium]|nr:bifunctional phosphoribosylaminoimidazolecarboxamide formyltransferase/IMP cyclohydrolase [Anaerolineaceae bacterium]